MNENPESQQGSDEEDPQPSDPTETLPVAEDPTATQQHPLTQPVPQVQPPSQPPYPGQSVVAGGEYIPAGGHPAPGPTWAPMPPPGSWGSPPAPGWGPAGPSPVPAPGGWGAGTGGGLPPTTWPPSPYGYYSAPLPAPTKQRNHKGQIALVASLVAVMALLLGAGIGHATWPTDTTSATASNGSNSNGNGSTGSGGSNFPFGSGSSGIGSSGSGSSGGTTGAGAPADISGIASKISPDLVDINTNLSYQDEQAAGTGMVLTSNGEVLTNNHVIDGATSISVTDIGNGQTYKANVVGYDRTGDVAVIQLVGASGLQTVPTGQGTSSVGEGVVGVGNAGGAGGTPSSAGGSVTALGQSITASDSGGGNSENLTGLIETNCDIQPGDSGGALVNSSGQRGRYGHRRLDRDHRDRFGGRRPMPYRSRRRSRSPGASRPAGPAPPSTSEGPGSWESRSRTRVARTVRHKPPMAAQWSTARSWAHPAPAPVWSRVTDHRRRQHAGQ